jgi:hypothetical protein
LTDRSGKAIAGLLFLIMLAGGSNVVTDSTNDTNTDNGEGHLGDGGDEDGQFEEDPNYDGGEEPEDPNDPCDSSSPAFNEEECYAIGGEPY